MNPDSIVAERADLTKQGKPVPPDPFGATVAVQNVAGYENVVPMLEMFAQYGGQFSVPEQVDAVWSVDGYHDLHGHLFGVAKMMNSVNKAVFASLKNGGVDLVADFANDHDPDFSKVDAANRTDGEAVKAELVAVGFVFDGESKALANPKDDHTKKTNDPSLGGMVDQYVMRFKKPMNAPNTDKRPPKDAMDGYFGNTNIMNRGTVDASPRQERRMFYHADGTYQEFGPAVSRSPMQSGTWYWDAAGHNCMLHQYPLDQRGFVVCHSTALYKKVGDNWTQEPAGGGNGPGTPLTIIKGYDPFIK
jgi:hypothetical protein